MIFDKHGKPKTKEIIIASDPEDKSCLLKPRAYITKDGIINVFMTCQSSRYVREYFFHSARSFTEKGKPLTDILIGPEIQSLEGYKKLLEQYVREEASLHELRLRNFKKKSKERDCLNKLIFPSIALEMKTFTSDQRMKNFFAAYCMDYKKYCNEQKFVAQILEQCLQEQ